MVNEKRTIEKHEQLIEELKALSFTEESLGSSVNQDVYEALNLRLNELLISFEAFEEKPEGLEELVQKAFRNTYDLNLKSFEDVNSSDSFSDFLVAHTNLHFAVKRHYNELWVGPDQSITLTNTVKTGDEK